MQDFLAYGGDHLGQLLSTLSAVEKQQITRLAVLPYTFDENDAAAMMLCGVDKARALLKDMHDHGLLLFNSECGQHYMHMSVRQKSGALSSPPATKANQQRFVLHMLQQLIDWAAMYITPAYALAIACVRQHTADFDEVWRLLTNSAELAEVCCEAAACAASPGVEDLLYGACLATRALEAWAALRQASTNKQQAAAFTFMIVHEALSVQEDVKGALVLFREVAEVQARLLGPQHPFTRRSTQYVAVCLNYQEDLADAEVLLLGLVKDLQQTSGRESVFDQYDLFCIQGGVADCWRGMGRDSEALALQVELVKGAQFTLGSEHPETLIVRHNMASTLDSLGRIDEAAAVFLELLQDCRRVVGREHPSTMAALRSLAGCLDDMERHAEAEPLWLEAVEISRRIQGLENAATLQYAKQLEKCRSHSLVIMS